MSVEKPAAPLSEIKSQPRMIEMHLTPHKGIIRKPLFGKGKFFGNAAGPIQRCLVNKYIFGEWHAQTCLSAF